MSHGHRSGDVDNVQRRSGFAQKGNNRWRIMNPKPNYPNGSVQKSQDRKTHLKFGQMWRYCPLFSSIAMTWCIMNSCHKEYCLEVISRLRQAILQKCTELWKKQSWILHYDKAPAQTSMLVPEFLAKNKIVIMPQPPYSLDLGVVDFFLFPKLKTTMKGKRFTMIEEIKEKHRSCWRYQKRVSGVFRGLEKKRWHKCITSEGG